LKGKQLMKQCLFVILILLAAAGSARAQQPDPVYLQRLLAAVEVQRNNAWNSQAMAEAKVSELTEALAKANARIKEIEEAKAEKPDGKKK
jgi:hypothetical protein